MMPAARESVVLVTPGALAWMREGGMILVVDEAGHRVFRLAGEEGLLWEWMTEGVGFDGMVARLGQLLDLDPRRSASRVRAQLDAWLGVGLLKSCSERGEPDPH